MPIAELIKNIKKGDDSRFELMNRFMPLAKKVSKKVTFTQPDLYVLALSYTQDIMLKAISNADPAMGDRFKGYIKVYLERELPKTVSKLNPKKTNFTEFERLILLKKQINYLILRSKNYRGNIFPYFITEGIINSIREIIQKTKIVELKNHFETLLPIIEGLVSDCNLNDLAKLLNKKTNQIDPTAYEESLDDDGKEGRRLISKGLIASQQLLKNEENIELVKTIFSLPEKLMIVMIGVYYMDMKKKVIAEVLGLKPSNMARLIVNAFEELERRKKIKR